MMSGIEASKKEVQLKRTTQQGQAQGGGGASKRPFIPRPGKYRNGFWFLSNCDSDSAAPIRRRLLPRKARNDPGCDTNLS